MNNFCGLEETCQKIVNWQRTVFVDATPESAAEHLYREVNELIQDPYDGQEMADIIFLVLQAADSAGVDLAEELSRKFAINSSRTWLPPDAQGVVEHFREQEDIFIESVALEEIQNGSF